jgi:hypothetical protein
MWRIELFLVSFSRKASWFSICYEAWTLTGSMAAISETDLGEVEVEVHSLRERFESFR